MKLQVVENGGAVVLRPAGDLDFTRLAPVEAELDALLAAGRRRFVFDLEGVRLLPSTGAGLLVASGRRVTAAGGRMVLCGLDPRVRATLSAMAVTDLFVIHESLRAALEDVDPGGHRGDV